MNLTLKPHHGRGSKRKKAIMILLLWVFVKKESQSRYNFKPMRTTTVTAIIAIKYFRVSICHGQRSLCPVTWKPIKTIRHDKKSKYGRMTIAHIWADIDNGTRSAFRLDNNRFIKEIIRDKTTDLECIQDRFPRAERPDLSHIGDPVLSRVCQTWCVVAMIKLKSGRALAGVYDAYLRHIRCWESRSFLYSMYVSILLKWFEFAMPNDMVRREILVSGNISGVDFIEYYVRSWISLCQKSLPRQRRFSLTQWPPLCRRHFAVRFVDG